jgi:hypothetical protein
MREGPRMTLRSIFAIALLSSLAALHAAACSICDPNFQTKPTLRQSARSAKFVVLGTLNNPRLVGDTGVTDVVIDQVVFDQKALGRQKTLSIPSYIPFSGKKPPRYLIFGELTDGKITITRGSPVTGEGVADYLRDSLKIDDRDRDKVMQFCYKHLDSTDPDVAADAFFEFAKASDQEVAALAGKLAPDKFRKLLKDQAHPERHGIAAYLLGACGTKDDVALITGLIRDSGERGNPALSGLLAGLIELQPQQGWQETLRILADPKRHFSDRLATIGTLRFYRACKGEAFRKEILQGLSIVLTQGDLADMAIEDLRRWQWWDATGLVLAQYGKPTHGAPLCRRSIIRYALCCPDASAAEFVAARRKDAKDDVARVEETLEFEKPTPTSIKRTP